MRVVVDCANGATTTIAPRLFQELGFEMRCIGCEPDGRNINLRCGSTAPEQLAKMVVDGGYPLGIAYDGDGDRAIFVDETGSVVDGDAVMLMCAKQMKREGRLKGNAIVATVMSNIGLEIALRDDGIEIVRCAVGDKYVMEEMMRRDLSLGGEQSGHVIFSEYLFTGDGLATSLNVLRTMGATGRTLSDLASELTTYPQVLVNVRVERKVDLKTVPAVAAVMSAVESRLAGNGRLLIRYSGTEPLLRIMIEGRDQKRSRSGRRRSRTRSSSSYEGRSHDAFRNPQSAPPSASGTCNESRALRMIKLSVNVNKVATVRNSRGGDCSVGARGRQGVCRAPALRASPCTRAPMSGTSRQPTSTRSPHTCAPLKGRIEFNIEGDPRPDLLELVHEVKPDQCTLVPVHPGEITSQAGWSADTPRRRHTARRVGSACQTGCA